MKRKQKKKKKPTTMNKFFCKATGGHSYDVKEMKFNHIIDGVYEIRVHCKKCGELYSGAAFMPGRGWIDNYDNMVQRWNRDNDK
jgi:formylmethanofuran dehydrogenase subunit E